MAAIVGADASDLDAAPSEILPIDRLNRKAAALPCLPESAYL